MQVSRAFVDEVKAETDRVEAERAAHPEPEPESAQDRAKRAVRERFGVAGESGTAYDEEVRENLVGKRVVSWTGEPRATVTTEDGKTTVTWKGDGVVYTGTLVKRGDERYVRTDNGELHALNADAPTLQAEPETFESAEERMKRLASEVIARMYFHEDAPRIVDVSRSGGATLADMKEASD